MIQFSDEILINRPVEQVFTFVADLENTPKWQTGVVNSKKVSEGPIQTGTKFKEVVRVLGRPLDTICEITEYQLNRKMAFKSTTSEAIEYEGQFTFESRDGGTRVDIAGTGELKGLWRLVEPLFAGDIKKTVGDELKQIKRFLETQAE